MKVKSVDPKSPPPKQYPWIGKSRNNGEVVLFLKHESGITLVSAAGNKVGHYSDTWNEDAAFAHFNGEITLSND